MKISSINNNINNSNYQKQNYKAPSYRNSVQIKFDEHDMEYGSIIGSLAGMVVAGMHLAKMNEKNLAKATLICAPIIATVSCATMGIMSFAKIINENRKNAGNK